jgi:peptide/nickel transport system substrate-binding protein
MMLRNKLYSLLFICCCLTACADKENAARDQQVFRYNEHSNISSLDPAFARDQSSIWIANQLFSGLVQLDDQLEVLPDIAKRWSLSEDGKTYTFVLRQDVPFHKHAVFGKDSTRFVRAADVVYSFKRLQDPQLASPGAWVLKRVSDFRAVNDSVFRIRLASPFPPFLSLLSMKYCSVVPEEVVRHYGPDFRSNPIGTGPFYLKLWVENTKLVLRKHQAYYEEVAGVPLPYLEAVSVRFLPDKQSEFLAFLQGKLDFINSIDPSYKDELLTPQGDLQPRYADQIDMTKAPFLNTEYLGILMDDSDSPAASLLIRKALNYGFDRRKMIRFLRNNIGIPAVHGFIPKGLPSFNAMEGYSYQPEKARLLVNQYKKLTGNDQPTVTITTNSQYVDLCEYLQRSLQKTGLEVLIDVVPPSTLRQAKAHGKLSIFRASWIADYPDAENYLSLFYTEHAAPAGPNYTRFSDSQFDAWYRSAVGTTDRSKRHLLYQKMDSLLVDKAPIVPLYYDQAVHFTQKNVQGLPINPLNLLHLKRVFKE